MCRISFILFGSQFYFKKFPYGAGCYNQRGIRNGGFDQSRIYVKFYYKAPQIFVEDGYGKK